MNKSIDNEVETHSKQISSSEIINPLRQICIIIGMESTPDNKMNIQNKNKNRHKNKIISPIQYFYFKIAGNDPAYKWDFHAFHHFPASSDKTFHPLRITFHVDVIIDQSHPINSSIGYLSVDVRLSVLYIPAQSNSNMETKTRNFFWIILFGLLFILMSYFAETRCWQRWRDIFWRVHKHLLQREFVSRQEILNNILISFSKIFYKNNIYIFFYIINVYNLFFRTKWSQIQLQSSTRCSECWIIVRHKTTEQWKQLTNESSSTDVRKILKCACGLNKEINK